MEAEWLLKTQVRNPLGIFGYDEEIVNKKQLYSTLNYSILSYDAMVYPGCQRCPHEMCQ